jgi:hypothetical protein
VRKSRADLVLANENVYTVLYLRCSVDTSAERIPSATNSRTVAYEVQRGHPVQFEGITRIEDEVQRVNDLVQFAACKAQ